MCSNGIFQKVGVVLKSNLIKIACVICLIGNSSQALNMVQTQSVNLLLFRDFFKTLHWN